MNVSLKLKEFATLQIALICCYSYFKWIDNKMNNGNKELMQDLKDALNKINNAHAKYENSSINTNYDYSRCLDEGEPSKKVQKNYKDFLNYLIDKRTIKDVLKIDEYEILKNGDLMFYGINKNNSFSFLIPSGAVSEIYQKLSLKYNLLDTLENEKE